MRVVHSTVSCRIGLHGLAQLASAVFHAHSFPTHGLRAKTGGILWGHFIRASLNRVLLIYISRLRFSLPDLSTLCKSAVPTKPNELLVESSKGALVSVVRRG
jgi:hypothetical protein